MTPIINERPYTLSIDVEGETVSVGAGQIVEVPDDLAGRAPTEDDPGEGLLAQPANWTKASRAKAKKAATADDLVEVPETEETN